MPLLPLRTLADAPTASIADEWLASMENALADPATDRATLCRRVLCEITYPEYASDWESAVADPRLPMATRLALSALDPRNIALEPEYYADCDDARF